MQTKKAITLMIAITAFFLLIIIPQIMAEFTLVNEPSTTEFALVNEPSPNNPQTNTQNTLVLTSSSPQNADEAVPSPNNFVVTQYSLTKDFNFYSKNQIINICSCGEFIDSITLQNTGNLRDSYDISSNVEYSRLSLNKITLDPGQKIDIMNYITPGCDDFSEDISITVVSSNGNSKTLTQTVNSVLCNNINASIENTTLKTYPCVPVRGKLFVKNPLSFSEGYHFSSDILKDSVIFSENPATINGKETKQINFTYSPSCGVNGDFKGNIIVDTEYTDLEQSLPINLSIEKRYRFDAFSQLYFETCNNLETWIPIIIKNNESFENTFKVTMENQKYFKIKNNTITVAPNSESATYIIAKPEWKDEGIIYLQYTVKSVFGDAAITKYAIANVSNCYNFNIMTKEETICSDKKETSFVLQNTGRKENNFSVEVNGVKFNKVLIEPNDTVEISVPLNLSDVDKVYTINLKASDGYNKKGKITRLGVLSLHSCYGIKIEVPDVNVNSNDTITNITVINVGIEKGKYNISLDAPFWAAINKNNLTLGKDKYNNILLLTTPGNISGEFKANLHFVENSSGQTYDKSFIIIVNGKTFMEKTKESFDNFISFVIKNSKVLLVGVLILFILIVIAAIIMLFYNMRKERLDQARKLIVVSSRRRAVRRVN